jgi:hypothetical protein
MMSKGGKECMCMNADDYEFADLRPDMLEEIRQLEAKFRRDNQQDITLIAYNRNESAGIDDNCRAGMDD